MAEDTKTTLDRLARTLRSEADELEHRHREQRNGTRQISRPGDANYQVGKIDGMRESARLLEG